MPRRSSSRGRGVVIPSSTANRSSIAPLDYFDDAWLNNIRERQYLRFIDLTSIQDRRRFHPSRIKALPIGPAPAGLALRPRIVIVPEGHRLSRLSQGRVPLRDVLKRKARIGPYRRVERYSLDYPVRSRVTDPSGYTRTAYVGDHFSRRVGFQYPWQVLICIRRRRRKEVIHALGHAGAGKPRQRRPRRNFYSEVRC